MILLLHSMYGFTTILYYLSCHINLEIHSKFLLGLHQSWAFYNVVLMFICLPFHTFCVVWLHEWVFALMYNLINITKQIHVSTFWM